MRTRVALGESPTEISTQMLLTCASWLVVGLAGAVVAVSAALSPTCSRVQSSIRDELLPLIVVWLELFPFACCLDASSPPDGKGLMTLVDCRAGGLSSLPNCSPAADCCENKLPSVSQKASVLRTPSARLRQMKFNMTLLNRFRLDSCILIWCLS